MTNEQRQLLLKDLCARWPYGVMLSTPNGNKTLLALIFSKKYNSIVEYSDYNGNENDISDWEGGDIEFVRPYLRPMSSMTEEEWGQYMNFIEQAYNDYDGTTTTCIDKERVHEYLNFIYSHHLDDNNLISLGLALEAPEDMYKV